MAFGTDGSVLGVLIERFHCTYIFCICTQVINSDSLFISESNIIMYFIECVQCHVIVFHFRFIDGISTYTV